MMEMNSLKSVDAYRRRLKADPGDKKALLSLIKCLKRSSQPQQNNELLEAICQRDGYELMPWTELQTQVMLGKRDADLLDLHTENCYPNNMGRMTTEKWELLYFIEIRLEIITNPGGHDD